MKPSLTSNLETLTQIPKNMSQWRRSWLGGKQPRNISTVITATINGIFFSFVIYVNGMLGREALIILANLSRFMAAKMDKTISHVMIWIKGIIKITVEKSYSHMIHGARINSPQ